MKKSLQLPSLPLHLQLLHRVTLVVWVLPQYQVLTHLDKRMHLAPVFSRKPVFMPLDLGHPLWVETDSVDIGFDIRRADTAGVLF